MDNYYEPLHLVEYYRYLRFFANGCVLFLTCAEEPKLTVTKLKAPAVSGEQSILKGTWALNASKVSIALHKKILKTSVNKYTRKQISQKTNENVDQDHYFRIV